MKADFNNLRLIALASYNELISELNKRSTNGTVTVEGADIQESLDDLRNALVTIACLYLPGKFESVIDQFGEVKEFDSNIVDYPDFPNY